ncbi:MAG: hypothetical protein ACOX1Y_08195 [Zhaonellaceae bacterium]
MVPGLALLSAFLADAELYILDEPTSGLDPLMELTFQECIREVKKQGKTVFLSSHILAEVEAICDRVGIIRQGEIVESGTLEKLRHLTRTTVTSRACQAYKLGVTARGSRCKAKGREVVLFSRH